MTSPNHPRLDRDNMLDAVEGLFVKSGFGACSLRDVIGACGVSTTAFYARFDGKEQMLDELIDRLIDRLRSSAAEALGNVASVDEGFRAGVDVLVATLLPKKAFVGLVLAEGSCSEGARASLRDGYDALANLLTAQLEQRGLTDARARGWALVGAVQMQVYRWAVLEDIADDGLADAVLTVARTLMPRQAPGDR